MKIKQFVPEISKDQVDQAPTDLTEKTLKPKACQGRPRLIWPNKDAIDGGLEVCSSKGSIKEQTTDYFIYPEGDRPPQLVFERPIVSRI